MEENYKKLDQEKLDTCKLLSIDQKQIQMENNILNGFHFRITKKTQTGIKKLGQLVQLISVQKSGAIFHTNKVIYNLNFNIFLNI